MVAEVRFSMVVVKLLRSPYEAPRRQSKPHFISLSISSATSKINRI